MSQNSGHTKNRSTIDRRCVKRHPHPNPLPEGEREGGSLRNPPLSQYSDKNQSTYDLTYKGQGEGVCHDYDGLQAFETLSQGCPYGAKPENYRRMRPLGQPIEST